MKNKYTLWACSNVMVLKISMESETPQPALAYWSLTKGTKRGSNEQNIIR